MPAVLSRRPSVSRYFENRSKIKRRRKLVCDLAIRLGEATKWTMDCHLDHCLESIDTPLNDCMLRVVLTYGRGMTGYFVPLGERSFSDLRRMVRDIELANAGIRGN